MARATFTPTATAYAAGDVMGGAQEFAGVAGKLGGLALIQSAMLMIAHTAVIASETTYRLHLYNVTPPSALADNAVWDLPAGDRSAYLGYIDFAQVVDIGSTVFVAADNINKVVNVASGLGGGSMWGYLVTVGGFTPTAAERTVTLNCKAA